MDKPKVDNAPGLKWRPRKNGWVALWIPRDDAVKRGYPSGSVNLSDFIHDPVELATRCRSLQDDMLLWLAGDRKGDAIFDGTIGSVLRIYETHPKSPYHALKPGSRHPYSIYLKRLTNHIGRRRVVSVIGLDVQGWWAVWIAPEEPKEPGALKKPPKLAAGQMALTVLKSALVFASVCGHHECRLLRQVIDDLTFPSRRPRQMVATADHVAKAREAALAAKRPSRATAYALQFETALRQWDVIGQWYPIAYPVLSAVTGSHGKWVGLMWSDIDDDMILRYTPSKTENTTEASVMIDLKMCPMALEELSRIPQEKRVGPVIINERTALPYTQQQFNIGWKADRKAADLSPALWSRDLRASAVTESRSGDGSLDDAAKVAGHSNKRTTAQVYDRENLEAHRRFQTARLSARNRPGTD